VKGGAINVGTVANVVKAVTTIARGANQWSAAAIRAAAAASRVAAAGTSATARVAAAQTIARTVAASADDVARAARPTSLLGRAAAATANTIRRVAANPYAQGLGLALGIGAPVYDAISTAERNKQQAASDAALAAAMAEAKTENERIEAQNKTDNEKIKKDNEAAIAAANAAIADQVASADAMNAAVEGMLADYEAWKLTQGAASENDILSILNGTGSTVAPSVSVAPPVQVTPTISAAPPPVAPPPVYTPPPVYVPPPVYTAPPPAPPVTTTPTPVRRRGGLSIRAPPVYKPTVPENLADMSRTMQDAYAAYLRMQPVARPPIQAPAGSIIVSALDAHRMMQAGTITPQYIVEQRHHDGTVFYTDYLGENLVIPPPPPPPPPAPRQLPFGFQFFKGSVPTPVITRPTKPGAKPILSPSMNMQHPMLTSPSGIFEPAGRSGGANMFLNMLKNAQAAMPPPASVPRRSKPSGFLGRRRGGLVLPRVATRVEANSAENEILNLLNGM